MPVTINSLYGSETRLAERELSAFVTAVMELFGSEQAKLSADDWFAEFELMDRSPRSVTVAASARLANRVEYRTTSLVGLIGQTRTFCGVEAATDVRGGTAHRV